MEVGQIERATQNRIIQLFQKELNYEYLGNWEEKENNSNIEEDILKKYLTYKGYSSIIISKALFELNKVAGTQNKSLYDINKDIDRKSTRLNSSHLGIS